MTWQSKKLLKMASNEYTVGRLVHAFTYKPRTEGYICVEKTTH